MFHGEKNNGNVKNKKDVFTDEKINNSPSSTTQTIIFPCIGPPGSGPGLLGSRPGVMKTDYLAALEHVSSVTFPFYVNYPYFFIFCM